MTPRGRKGILAGTAAAAVATLAVVLLVRTLGTGWSPERLPEPDAALAVDRAAVADALARYVRIDTSNPPGIEGGAEARHVRFLVQRYAQPLGLAWEVSKGGVLVMRWQAARPAGPPLLLLSHADVVPVADGERERWSHPPFAGVIDGGYVWGRGALDDKASTLCQLEAIAALQRHGKGPRRDVLVVVGPDEETGGTEGIARLVAERLADLGPPALVLDEGSFVVPDFLPGAVFVPVGVAEKRFVNVRLVVEGEAGHSSMPRRDAPPVVLSRALGKLADFRMPVRKHAAVEVMLDRMADRMPFAQRLVLRNRWLFGPKVDELLSADPGSNAMIRDTAALTILRGGIKENVVPGRVEAVLNLRLLPGTKRERVSARIRAAIGDPRVRFEVLSDSGDPAVSPFRGEPWRRLEAVLASAVPHATVTPFLTPGTTDARWFASRGVPSYRLLPFTLDAGERSRMHGIDERLSLANLEQGVRVYAHLIRHF